MWKYYKLINHKDPHAFTDENSIESCIKNKLKKHEKSFNNNKKSFLAYNSAWNI